MIIISLAESFMKIFGLGHRNQINSAIFYCVELIGIFYQLRPNYQNLYYRSLHNTIGRFQV